jgi:hypothetical protein
MVCETNLRFGGSAGMVTKVRLFIVLQAADGEVRELARVYANDSTALTEVWRLLNSQSEAGPTLLDLRWEKESGEVVLLKDLQGWASTR